jgi:Peptidogalycan biosysnthesis/recognition
MSGLQRTETGGDGRLSGVLELVPRAELARSPHWARAFSGRRKDHRYYELLEDTLKQGFDYRYFAIRDSGGEICSVQPFFILDQDLVAGVGGRTKASLDFIRRAWPRCLMMRTLMVGCVAGEGHLDADESSAFANARLLACGIVPHARNLRAPLIVFKEFPTQYRAPLACLLTRGFSRVPSLPMTCLNIDYADFEDYMNKALNSATRRKLRKKFRIAAQAAPIRMSIVHDVTPFIDEIYPLYLQVYERSKLHFEKLTKDFFCGIGRVMPDKVRFFIWRQETRIVAFTLCMFEGKALYAEYIGLDYSVALQLHLYHYAVRDMTAWAIAEGYRWFRSSGLNYDPKLHLRHRLDPIDLYVRHCSPVVNAALKWLLPLIEPTRYDPSLRKFANYGELWGDRSP